MTWTWAEPFAGAAACALRVVGGPDLRPPVAWMGGKRRYAEAILDAMGVPAGRPGRVLLADAGPWGWVWPLLLRVDDAAKVAAVLRSWAGEHPRDLWQRLAAQPPAEEVPERAAQWLWLQARSASGVPIWWDGWRLRVEGRTVPQSTWDLYGDTNAGRWQAMSGRGTPQRPGFNTGQAARDERGEWLASDGRGNPRPAGARAVGGRWEKGNEGRVQDASNGQRGSWRFDARPGDSAPDRAAGPTGVTNGRTGGMVNPATIAGRIEATAQAFADVDVHVHHGDSHAHADVHRVTSLPPVQAPPHSDAELSTSPMAASKAVEKRDQKPHIQGELFPVPGDILHLGGGLRWRVVDREPAHVSFVVEGMDEPPRRVSLRHWQRVAERSR